MKTAIYIEDGVVQLVLTPENKFEENAITTMIGKDGNITAKIFDGSFYDCRGGWISQSNYYRPNLCDYSGSAKDKSIIIRVDTPSSNEKD